MKFDFYFFDATTAISRGVFVFAVFVMRNSGADAFLLSV
jgi:hypothetical protein